MFTGYKMFFRLLSDLIAFFGYAFFWYIKHYFRTAQT